MATPSDPDRLFAALLGDQAAKPSPRSVGIHIENWHGGAVINMADIDPAQQQALIDDVRAALSMAMRKTPGASR